MKFFERHSQQTNKNSCKLKSREKGPSEKKSTELSIKISKIFHKDLNSSVAQTFQEKLKLISFRIG